MNTGFNYWAIRPNYLFLMNFDQKLVLRVAIEIKRVVHD